MKNKKNLIFISLGAVTLLLIIFVSYIYYQKNMSNKVNDFSSYVNEYKQEISNYSLSDNQENYDNLIAEAEKTIANKDYKKISSLTSSLNELKEMVLTLNNDSINNFSNYVNTYKEELDNYNLDDSKEKYDSLIAEAEQAIANKDYKNIDFLTSNLNQFKEEVLNKNIKIISNTISELESMDISKISDKDSINSKIEEIKKLKDEKQFVTATELSNTLKEDIDNQLEVIKQEENKNNNLSEIDSIILSGVNINNKLVTITYNYVNPINLESYKSNYGSGFKAVINLDSTDKFILTTEPFDNNAKPESFNDALTAHVLEKTDEYYLIEYQAYSAILIGGNGFRFQRKIFLDGSIYGNFSNNEPYSKLN